MQDNKLLMLVYTFFLGLLMAIFVGVGINTFYAPPKAPKYPIELNNTGKELTEEQKALEKTFNKEEQAHQEKMKPYNRNVSIMTLVAAVALLAVSIMFERKMHIIADGVMLGGLFTLLYSLGRGFASEDSKYVFMVVTIGLAVVIYLGYHRFIQDHSGDADKPKLKAL